MKASPVRPVGVSTRRWCGSADGRPANREERGERREAKGHRVALPWLGRGSGPGVRGLGYGVIPFCGRLRREKCLRVERRNAPNGWEVHGVRRFRVSGMETVRAERGVREAATWAASNALKVRRQRRPGTTAGRPDGQQGSRGDGAAGVGMGCAPFRLRCRLCFWSGAIIARKAYLSRGQGGEFGGRQAKGGAGVGAGYSGAAARTSWSQSVSRTVARSRSSAMWLRLGSLPRSRHLWSQWRHSSTCPRRAQAQAAL